MKYVLTIILSLMLTVPVYASEVTGTITTGLNTGDGVEGIVLSAPTADPVSGVYTETKNVILSGSAGILSIHYTTDGSAASCASGDVYSSSIEVSTSLVIEAISCYPNNAESAIAIFGYTINPPNSGGGGGGGGGIDTTLSTENTDFNNDGKVDIFDFNILIFNWGNTGATSLEGDANGDGVIDILDFNLLIVNWQS